MEVKKKNDRRVIRTKSALREAFIEIVKEKLYENVTVEDITTRANVGRTTFYLHYQDKEDLLLEGLEGQLISIVDEFNQHPLKYWFSEKNDKVSISVFENIKNNRELYRIMTRDQSNNAYERFIGIIKKTAWKLITESAWTKKQIEKMTIPVDLVIEYYSGAMWSSIVWWVRNDFETPADEMANACLKLFYPGLIRALNVEKMSDLIGNL